MESREATLSPSPSRTKVGGRTIQFTAPPPPIAKSVLLPHHKGSSTSRRGSEGIDGAVDGRYTSPHTSLKKSRRNSGGIDPLLVLERRERALQKELQELLDAQSAGLIQGFGGKDGSEGSEAGSSTPTYGSTRSRSAGMRDGTGGVVPVRQPRKKVVSLRGARRGLLRDMSELASIKSQSISLLSLSIAQRESVLQKVSLWEERIVAFQKQIFTAASDLNNTEDEDGRQLAELKIEEKAVGNEIMEMEDRLAQMRARRSWIRERVREGENKREANLSSYKGALKEVEGEVREFLRRPPVFASALTNQEVAGDAGFMDLPVGRRTLGMAKDHWGVEIEEIERRKVDMEEERGALEEGVNIWEDAARSVMEFEDGLRVQMKGDVQNPEVLREQVKIMGKVIEELEGHVKVAEERRWNLLICALGAELEAFREGEDILKGALGMVEAINGIEEGKLLDDGIEASKGTVAEELSGRQDRLKDPVRGENISREESEDDEPPGELLVDNSHGDGESSLD